MKNKYCSCDQNKKWMRIEKIYKDGTYTIDKCDECIRIKKWETEMSEEQRSYLTAYYLIFKKEWDQDKMSKKHANLLQWTLDNNFCVTDIPVSLSDEWNGE